MELKKIEEQAFSLQKIAGHVQGRTPEELEAFVLNEISYLKERVELAPALQECREDSLLMCIRHALRDNVSLDANAGLVYIYPQKVKVANGQYVSVAHYELSPNGRISLARQTGNILDFERPQLIKEGEKVVGGFMKILKPSYPEPRWETYDYNQSDIDRWAKFSSKKNKKWDNAQRKFVEGSPNALYSSGPGGGIDEGFMKAKIVKHTLKQLGINASERVGQKIVQDKSLDFEPALTIEETQKLEQEEFGGDFEVPSGNEL